MDFENFVGRDAEVRTILGNVAQGRSTLLIGEPGVGKSALLSVLEPLLQEEGKVVYVGRVSPFGTFLRELFIGLHDVGVVSGESGEAQTDLKSWNKLFGNNDERAKELVNLVTEQGVILVIDDASGITASARPWLESLVEACTVLAATSPEALNKTGSKRFWKRFDEVQLGRLSKTDAGMMLDGLISRYKVKADEPEMYKRKVLELAQGSPFELVRLVKYHSSETLVRARELSGLGQQFVETDVKGVALAPLLLIVGVFVIAGRAVGRAQGNMDLIVISGIGIGILAVFAPFIRNSIRPKSK